MQIPVPLIIFGRAAAQLLQAKQAVNVLEEKLALVAQRIAEHLANIIDRQAGGAAPDPIEYPRSCRGRPCVVPIGSVMVQSFRGWLLRHYDPVSP
jgi:hypothetical protein